MSNRNQPKLPRHNILPVQIIRIEALSNYSKLYFINRKTLVTARVLNLYEAQLQDAGFIRTLRSHLVNKHHIAAIQEDGSFVMADAFIASISKRKTKTVMAFLRV
jgi:two-component system, LytTR family, response regulator